ncbi:helix-hairpin-helix domain-containing protein [Thiothrix subterranea]|uniref:helix-hairpin-helix domain-containing protein n=1 Tax=Thiothrix subterranea TaxID=2735563 RepID=UPI00192B28D0|nr:helix-hairpin-helix domain-containing protein [Thiothrix subterranea]QQZ30448.1 helix-hairpin-helix domain-containing protein [Thiothrix subterranea]
MELEVVAIKYVGPATVKRLAEHGITTVEQLAAMSVEALTALPGIGENTAPLIIANAQDVLAAPLAAPEPETPEPIAIESAEVTEVMSETSSEPELSAKVQKKLAKQAKKLKKAQKAEKKALRKAEKKAEKKAAKHLKAEQKAAEKAEKKAAKQAKKADKKAAKQKS